MAATAVQEIAAAASARTRLGPFQLDPVQQDVDQKTRARIAEGRGGLVVAPTGFGKGVLVCGTVDGLRGRGPVLVIQPSADLIRQNLERLRAADVIGDDDFAQVSVLCDQTNRITYPNAFKQRVRHGAGAPIVLATQNSVQRMATTPEGRAALARFQGVVFDEAHRAGAEGISQALEIIPGVKIGYTATPFRGDDRDIGELFGRDLDDALIRQVTVAEAVESGRVVPGMVAMNAQARFRELVGEEVAWAVADEVDRRVARGEGVDLASERAMGAYFAGDASAKMRAAGDRMIEATVRLWGENAGDRTTFVHCENVEHARRMYDGFKGRRLGGRAVNAACIDGEEVRIQRGGQEEVFAGAAAKRARQDAIEMARRGEIDVLTNCNVFREGIDVPRASCSIVACQRKSLLSLIQSVGRAARAFDDPATGTAKRDHLVLDLGESVARLAVHDRRVNGGELDLAEVARTSVPAAFLRDAVDTFSGDMAALRGLASDFQTNTRRRAAARAAAEKAAAPSPPARRLSGREMMARAVETPAHTRPMPRRPEPESAFKKGARVYSRERPFPGSRDVYGSGTFLGMAANGRCSVQFDRTGTRVCRGEDLIPEAKARAQGLLGAEARKARRVEENRAYTATLNRMLASQRPAAKDAALQELVALEAKILDAPDQTRAADRSAPAPSPRGRDIEVDPEQRLETQNLAQIGRAQNRPARPAPERRPTPRARQSSLPLGPAPEVADWTPPRGFRDVGKGIWVGTAVRTDPTAAKNKGLRQTLAVAAPVAEAARLTGVEPPRAATASGMIVVTVDRTGDVAWTLARSAEAVGEVAHARGVFPHRDSEDAKINHALRAKPPSQKTLERLAGMAEKVEVARQATGLSAEAPRTQADASFRIALASQWSRVHAQFNDAARSQAKVSAQDDWRARAAAGLVIADPKGVLAHGNVQAAASRVSKAAQGREVLFLGNPGLGAHQTFKAQLEAAGAQVTLLGDGDLAARDRLAARGIAAGIADNPDAVFGKTDTVKAALGVPQDRPDPNRREHAGRSR